MFSLRSISVLATTLAAWSSSSRSYNVGIRMAGATGTEDSTLHCDGLEATPGERFTCRIQLLDELQEPTIAASVSDFAVHVSSDVDEATVSVTALERTEGDATLLHFHVSSDMGCHLRVDVVLTSNRRLIRNSGVTLLVLASPPTAIGPLVCGDENFQGGLALRQSVECSAAVTGAHGIPALVRKTDVLLSEDHSDGSIQFLDGRRNLKIRYTAPIKPSLTYSDFVLRVTLAGSRVSGETSLALPVIYPVLHPTSRTTISCSRVARTDQSYCNLEAFDDVGPIKFDPSQFDVFFQWQPSAQIKKIQGLGNAVSGGAEEEGGNEQENDNMKLSSEIEDQEDEGEGMAVATVPASDAWMPADDLFTWEWMDVSNERVSSIAQLRFSRISNDFVFPFRLHIQAKTVMEQQVEVTNSPYVGTSGVAPTPMTVTFEECTRRFMSAGQRTECTVRVDRGTSADPTYITAASESGETGVAHIETPEGNATSEMYNPLLIRFPFVAPEEIEEREVAEISIEVEGIVVGSTRLVVYPRFRQTDNGAAERLEQEKQIQKILGVGLTFFVACFLWGLVVFAMRLRRISHVKAMRRQVEENQMQADLAQRRQTHMENRRRSVAERVAAMTSEMPEIQITQQQGLSVSADAVNDNDKNQPLSAERGGDAHATPKRVDFSFTDVSGAAAVPPKE